MWVQLFRYISNRLLNSHYKRGWIRWWGSVWQLNQTPLISRERYTYLKEWRTRKLGALRLHDGTEHVAYIMMVGQLHTKYRVLTFIPKVSQPACCLLLKYLVVPIVWSFQSIYYQTTSQIDPGWFVPVWMNRSMSTSMLYWGQAK